MTRVAAKPPFLALVIGLLAAAATPGFGFAAEPGAPGGFVKSDLDTLSEGDVRGLQDALIWTGDYVGLVNGTVGSRTRDAIAAYLKRIGIPPSGPLDPGWRARLLGDAKVRRQAVGFAPIEDKRAGVALSLPTRLLPKQTGTDAGTRFSSQDGEIVVDTLSRPASGGGLPDVFARMSAAAGSRKVTYKVLRPDFFVVSGEIGDHAFYSRFVEGKADGIDVVRGFTMSYPKSAAARLDAVTLAVSASFDPFPASPKPTPEAAKPPSVPGATSPTSVDAVLVAPDVALSRISRRTCPVPRVGGAAVTFRAQDERTGLALLGLARAPGAPVGVSLQPIARGQTLMALFRVASADGQMPLQVAPVDVASDPEPEPTSFTVSAPLQGRSAFLFDGSGALAGITDAAGRTPPSISGTMLQTDYRAIGPVAIGEFLERAGMGRGALAPTGDRSFGERASALRPSVLSVACTGGSTATP